MPFPKDFPGNVHKPHGRNHSVLLFIRFKSSSESSLASSIQLRCREFVEYVSPMLTFYQEQVNQRQSIDKDSETTFISLGISRSGFKRLGVDEEKIPHDPVNNRYFEKSMLDATISDNFWLYMGSEQRKLIEPSFKVGDDDSIDLILIIANDNIAKLYLVVRQICASQQFIYSVASHSFEYGRRDPDHLGPLGFKDNISNEDEPENIYHYTKVDKRNPLTEEDLSIGVFMVYQKIRVNKEAFNKLVTIVASNIDVTPPLILKYNITEIAEAYLIGRFKDGTPLLFADKNSEDVKKQNFNYNVFDDAGGVVDYQKNKCPFSSHIRSANPRSWGERNTEDQHVPIIRRGINFSYPAFGKEENVSGLHFLSYQRSVDSLVQIMKRMKDRAEGVDASFYRLSSSRDKAKFPKVWGQGNEEFEVELNGMDISQFLGGEIFFMPAKHYLEEILADVLDQEEAPV